MLEGRIVLLDLSAGTYDVFDATATAMWNALLGVPRERCVAVLGEQFDARSDRISADLVAFERSCIARGAHGARAARHAWPTIAWTLLAWRALASTAFRLRIAGFPDVYRRYAAIPKFGAAVCDRSTLARAERAFLRAENFFVLRSAPRDCLPRSLSLYRFLLAIGFAPEHHIGVQRYHFEAHGWVRCEGRPVVDTAQFVARYSDLAVL
jgi:hypothetical protein